jgi:UDP-2,3-diacylglucosamine pyrophosphatase LpxH
MSNIADELTRTLNGQFSLSLTLDLEASHKFIVFSDQHKGAGDEADEFRKCKDTYIAALQHYLQNGFSLILLGDVEELWEQGFKKVERRYRDVLQLEASFPPGRYYRIWGNHDDEWMIERKVRRRLANYMPTGAIYEAIRFELINDSESVGTMLLLHGHQGTFASDKIRWFSRFAVRVYRYIQRITGLGKTTPAKDACLRGKHDTEMYNWAVKQNNLILVVGHTHRPVWSSRTHLQKLQSELEKLKAGPDTKKADSSERAGGTRTRKKIPTMRGYNKNIPFLLQHRVLQVR